MRTLSTFHGGIHPDEHKDESSRTPIAQAPVPKRLTLPLRQHIGGMAVALVQPGDKVLKGQMIAKAEGFISAAIHAPTSGTVLSVDMQRVPHPSGLPDLCLTLESDGEDRWIERHPTDWRAVDRDALLRDSGIVGLGGAVFPTHVKLSTGQSKVETLVINGAECEPWITCDDRLMRERAGEIVKGIEIMARLVEAGEVLIGVEDNKPDAAEAMSQACQGTGFEVVVIPTLYPSGGEKQLIKILTGKEVPTGQRPLNIGVVCSNVATAYAVNRAVNRGEPMISRIVTVTGDVAQPGNYEALIGTPLTELVELAGGAAPDTRRFILGGPMMGLDLHSLDLPLMKGGNCIIAASPRLFPPRPAPSPCIRCGNCARACPVELQPLELFWFTGSKDFDRARKYNLFDCIECGVCSYVCPSNIPLVNYFRFGKSEILAQDRSEQAAMRARQRHENKQQRLEREKAERAAKLAAAKAPESDADKAAKKAAIQAAVERAKAQKAAAQAATESEEKQPEGSDAP